jgi:hypothetical protein
VSSLTIATPSFQSPELVQQVSVERFAREIKLAAGLPHFQDILRRIHEVPTPATT